MEHPTTVAVDLAKTSFEVALATAAGRILARHRFTSAQFGRFLRSLPPTHLVMEARGTAHFWGRTAQSLGHQVSLLPAQYVRPYVRRQKTDRTDAEALLEAMRSGGLQPVTVKTVAQQELLALHRMRQQWLHTRTAPHGPDQCRPRLHSRTRHPAPGRGAARGGGAARADRGCRGALARAVTPAARPLV